MFAASHFAPNGHPDTSGGAKGSWPMLSARSRSVAGVVVADRRERGAQPLDRVPRSVHALRRVEERRVAQDVVDEREDLHVVVAEHVAELRLARGRRVDAVEVAVELPGDVGRARRVVDGGVDDVVVPEAGPAEERHRRR